MVKRKKIKMEKILYRY